VSSQKDIYVDHDDIESMRYCVDKNSESGSLSEQFCEFECGIPLSQLQQPPSLSSDALEATAAGKPMGKKGV
jgi:hypothetical protein